jgi:hypothetical protein
LLVTAPAAKRRAVIFDRMGHFRAAFRIATVVAALFKGGHDFSPRQIQNVKAL